MNIIDIEYDDPSFEARAPEPLVRERLENILSALGQDSIEMSCSFVSDERIQELNKEWRNKDESTDILTFVQSDIADDCDDVEWPAGFDVADDHETTEDDGSVDAVEQTFKVLGDMIISLDSLKRNADYFRVTDDEELYRLLVHGILHLLGEDHATNDPSEPMLTKQEQLLLQLRG